MQLLRPALAFASLLVIMSLILSTEKKEEEDYKLWPANKSDRSWQSLSNPAKRHSLVSKLNVSDLQIEMPCQHHMPELVRLNKGLNKSKSLTPRPHLHMKSRAIIVINIVYRHRVITEAR